MKDERKHLTAAEVDRKCDVIQKLHNDIERRRQVKIRLFLDEDIQDSMRNRIECLQLSTDV